MTQPETSPGRQVAGLALNDVAAEVRGDRQPVLLLEEEGTAEDDAPERVVLLGLRLDPRGVRFGWSGRSMARAPVAEGFQRHPFRYHVAWVHSSAWVTFRRVEVRRAHR